MGIQYPPNLKQQASIVCHQIFFQLIWKNKLNSTQFRTFSIFDLKGIWSKITQTDDIFSNLTSQKTLYVGFHFTGIRTKATEIMTKSTGIRSKTTELKTESAAIYDYVPNDINAIDINANNIKIN